MKNFLSSRCRARLLATVVGLGWASSLLAQPLPYIGRWLLDDQAEAQASPSILTVKEASMTWSGPNKSAPACVQQFVVKKENPGSVYTDGHGTKFVAGSLGSLPTYLLKVSASTCGGANEDVRIRFPLVYDINHIEVIEYVNGKPVSARRFHRKK
ncbi:MAG TPA: hypothetical protein VF793_07325 [Telluria sp.]|jgi:hypothetical protein